ncbi:MAG: glycosyltransferase family 2 protein, partial [Acidobacteriaceae bacterium]
MGQPKYSIVIPAFNESARIGKTLERVLACVAHHAWDAEVLVVDDGSRDTTVSIVEAW